MVALSRQNLNQSIGALIVALLGIGAVIALQKPQLNSLVKKSATASAEDIKKDLESERLQLELMQKLPSFGFDNMIGNWAFIKFAQYFGDETARDKSDYSLSPEYFKVIINRDPYFLDAYRFLSSSTTLYAGMPESTVALMQQGLKSLAPKVPDKSYYIWRYKGTDELLFLGDSQAAKQSFETAGKWADTYSDDDSKYLAKLSHQTAQFLAKNPNSKSAQVSAWSMVLNNAFDDRVRKIAISRIQSLGGTVSITPDGQVKVQPPKKD
jgi:predicted secreted protein